MPSQFTVTADWEEELLWEEEELLEDVSEELSDELVEELLEEELLELLAELEDLLVELDEIEEEELSELEEVEEEEEELWSNNPHPETNNAKATHTDNTYTFFLRI